MKVVRAGWTSASFLVYAGALLSLVAAFAWLAVISADHSQGAYAGWTVLFCAVAETCAFGLLARNRPLVAGLFAFVLRSACSRLQLCGARCDRARAGDRHYSLGKMFGLGGGSFDRPTTWAGPVAYVCLGLFFVLVGKLLHRRRAAEST